MGFLVKPASVVPGLGSLLLNPNGTPDNQVIFGTTGLSAVTKFTMFFWLFPVYYDDTNFPILFYGNPSFTDCFSMMSLSVDPADAIFLLRNSGQGLGACYYQSAGYPILTQRWNSFIVVFDGTQSTNVTKLKVYINGAPMTGGVGGSDVPTAMPTLTGDNDRLTLNAGGAAPTWWNHVAVWPGIALTDAGIIAALAGDDDTVATPDECGLSGLAHYWPLTENLLDVVGTSHGTAAGTAAIQLDTLFGSDIATARVTPLPTPPAVTPPGQLGCLYDDWSSQRLQRYIIHDTGAQSIAALRSFPGTPPDGESNTLLKISDYHTPDGNLPVYSAYEMAPSGGVQGDTFVYQRARGTHPGEGIVTALHYHMISDSRFPELGEDLSLSGWNYSWGSYTNSKAVRDGGGGNNENPDGNHWYHTLAGGSTFGRWAYVELRYPGGTRQDNGYSFAVVVPVSGSTGTLTPGREITASNGAKFIFGHEHAAHATYGHCLTGILTNYPGTFGYPASGNTLTEAISGFTRTATSGGDRYNPLDDKSIIGEWCNFDEDRVFNSGFNMHAADDYNAGGARYWDRVNRIYLQPINMRAPDSTGPDHWNYHEYDPPITYIQSPYWFLADNRADQDIALILNFMGIWKPATDKIWLSFQCCTELLGGTIDMKVGPADIITAGWSDSANISIGSFTKAQGNYNIVIVERDVSGWTDGVGMYVAIKHPGRSGRMATFGPIYTGAM